MPYPAKQIIRSEAAPAPVGPYSQAVKVGDLLFLSGQIPLHPDSGRVVDGEIEDQTDQVLANLRAVLHEVGLTMDHLVKTTIYLTNLADFPRVNEVYGRYFGDQPPARACVEVARLPKDVDVEIEGIAHIGAS